MSILNVAVHVSDADSEVLLARLRARPDVSRVKAEPTRSPVGVHVSFTAEGWATYADETRKTIALGPLNGFLADMPSAKLVALEVLGLPFPHTSSPFAEWLANEAEAK